MFLQYYRSFVSLVLMNFSLFSLPSILSGEGEDYTKYAMFAQNAEKPQAIEPVLTKFPLILDKSSRIALIGNTLFDRMRNFGHFEYVDGQKSRN